MERQIIKGISLIKNSDYRKRILISLSDINYLTPSEISQKTKIRLNHVSNFLKDLKDSKLILCLNDEDKRGRLYQITDLGKKVIKENGTQD
ncbi:MarR family transcriptional regulator [Candidatus Woesearchaeota archaeon]|nr:MarR family transcriptional regulator [Candidatus Woesearchaeota archaeon]MBI4156835.1 MarR family transcriptional regulator [Candidatus Woesearchaeota archaeon]